MAPTIGGPLILLSPAKSLNFDVALGSALAKVTPNVPKFLSQSEPLVKTLAAMKKSEIKSLMGLSDSLAELNHQRFTGFEKQPERIAIGAFTGQAYQGLDAESLSPKELDYCQDHLRILCGLYGILKPYDALKPYRLEMSTKLACGDTPNLYQYWGDALTDAIAAEKPKWVLNVASQEYAKSINLKTLAAPPLSIPVITAAFPGPAVHAKMARGMMVRFCAQNNVDKPEALRAFCGNDGEWSYVPEASDEVTYTFKRSAPAKTEAKATGKKRAKAEEAEEEEDGGSGASGAGRRTKKK